MKTPATQEEWKTFLETVERIEEISKSDAVDRLESVFDNDGKPFEERCSEMLVLVREELERCRRMIEILEKLNSKP